MQIKSNIISFANSIGIEYIGFCSANFSKDFIKRLEYSKQNGYNCEFQEQDILKRVNVFDCMEDAKTFISIAIPYKTLNIDTTKPYFSKSSLGLDYHIVVKKKLQIIENYIQANFNAKTLSFVDTGAFHDREIAYMCGIGFYGKNSTIITPKYGSYVFLGEILTNICIEPDLPISSMCGDCQICIKACPSGAIKEPYCIDSNTCLSYITQKKDDLSKEEQNKIGLRIYGCDTCQDVCPFNKSSKESNILDFLPPDWNIHINEESFLKMSNKVFNETFKKTSSGWRGKKVLQRNLIIAMGNSKNKNYIPLLKSLPYNEYLDKYINNSINKLEGLK
ncbi:MAG: tRNA epoxyqueuosine(34) reductase QueG [Clostridiales bacterium]|nr:tRNA epoxyqueuosine(34) reductase QueG [Clostridiales bacterium]